MLHLLQTFDFTADDLVDEGEIGRGAYGTVNRMVHSRSGTIMAVKVGALYEPTCLLLKVNVNMHTHDIAPLRSESPLLKHSGMVRVLKGFHSFTCTPTRSSAIGMNHLSLPSQAQLVLIYRPRRDGRLSRPWCEVAQAEI